MRFSFSGENSTIARQLLTAVPSIFPWNKQETESSVKRIQRKFAVNHDKRIKSDQSCRNNLEKVFRVRLNVQKK